MELGNITLVLGVDALHLEELRHTWPTWMRFKPELLQMPVIVFYDPEEMGPEDGNFLHEHPNLRWVPWQMPEAQTQREKMITAWVHVPAMEVKTEWYLKLDTDVVATGAGDWIRDEWFQANADGELPVFVSSRWGYSKPAHVVDLLDDWADDVPELAQFPRLNLPREEGATRVRHKRIISWIFFGRTAWTAEVVRWLRPERRLPHPSQDTFLFYCAERGGRHYVRDRMSDYGWQHARPSKIRELISRLAITSSCEPELAAWTGGRVFGDQSVERGVIYYNVGRSCAVRLLVSVSSLRKHYAGPVTILSEGDDSHGLCRRIAKAVGADFQEWDCGVPDGRNRAYLAKTQYHLASPYKLTVALDSDTLVLGPIDELFDEADGGEFCVARLAMWRSDGKRIGERIRQWEPWLGSRIEKALSFGPAINCGVVAFRRGAKIFDDWLRLALPGRETFIPDEVCCQVILHEYAHRILDPRWNRSCRHDDPDKPDTRIVHFHGRKHCRPGLPFHGGKWIAALRELEELNTAGIREWMPAGDRMLKQYLGTREGLAEAKTKEMR